MAVVNQHYLLPLLVLSLCLLVYPSAATPTPYPKETSFIIKSCNVTTYPKFCLQTLLPNATRIEAQPKMFAFMAISNTLLAAKHASTSTIQLSKQNGLKSHEVSALRNCAKVVGDSTKNLNQALEMIGHLGGGTKAEKEYKRRNVENLVATVDMVEDSCIEGLLEMRARSVVVNRIRDAVVPLAHHAANVHDILNHLVF